MTRHYLGVVGLASISLWLAPGCGSVCGDDGWVWNQADNPACVPAAEASATETGGSGTEGTTVGDTPSSVTEEPTTEVQPTMGSATQGGSEYCKDADGDGFGDPTMCEDSPFPGSVPNGDDCDDGNADAFPGAAENESNTACMQDADGDGWGDSDPDPGVEPGTDCDDDNANAFPGAAENESDTACMEDADGDGWGDSMPGPGVDPGTDCNDDDMSIFPGAAENDSPDACMQDEDGDGYGDSMPGPGADPGTDCDDGNEFTFPGAAPKDSPDACMKDEDGDDYGDDFGGNPPPPDVVPGTDCNDTSPFTFPGAAEVEGPDACMTDEDDDGYGATAPAPGADPGTDCADTDVEVHLDCEPCQMDGCLGDDLVTCSDGGNVIDKMTCDFGCDDVGLKCWDPLEVDAGPTVCIDVGGSTPLSATVMGGDGTYTYDWTPFDTLDDPAIANPTASPVGPTTYTVNVTDGEGSMASDNVTVYLNNLSLNLDPNQCTTFDFKGTGESDPDTLWQWNANTKELCQTVNGKGSALFCGWELHNATIKGTFSVKTIDDDDWTGFMWGIQDTDHFYLFTWKQIAQNFANCGGNLPTGMQVKVINVADPVMNPLTCADRHQNGDTVNSKMLVPTDQFYDQGWLDNTDYLFELTHKDTGEITIVVRNKLLNTVVAQKTFMDTTYPSGKFGMYTKSQISACFSDYKTFCIP